MMELSWLKRLVTLVDRPAKALATTKDRETDLFYKERSVGTHLVQKELK